jgi:hypothetical protein
MPENLRSDREDETPLTVWIPTPLHQKLKVLTAKRRITLKEYVRAKLAEDVDDTS